MFVTYLLMYYAKYFPGNVYVNYSIASMGDMFYSYYIKQLNTRLKSVPRVTMFLIFGMIFFTIVYIVLDVLGMYKGNLKYVAVPLLIMLVRLNSKGILQYGYHSN